MAACLVVGAAAATFVLTGPAMDAHLSWLSPALDVSTFVMLCVVSSIGAADAWVRADRRALPIAGALVMVAVLWLADVPASNDAQIRTALFALAQTGTPVILLMAFFMSRPGRATMSPRSLGLTLTKAAAASAGLVTATVLTAPHLPAMTSSGRYTTFGQLAVAAGVLPLVVALSMCVRSAVRGHDLGDPMVGAWVLLLFASVAAVGIHTVGSAGWLVVAGLRSGAFVLVTFGELRLCAVSARSERRRAEDLAVLYEATNRIGTLLDPVSVADALVDMVETTLSGDGISIRARVLQVDGTAVSALTGGEAHDPALGDVAVSFPLAEHQLLGKALRTAQPASQRTPTPTLVVPITSGSDVCAAIEISSPSPARAWQTPENVALVQGFAGLAALALANAETFDDLQAAEAYNRAVLMAINDALISITLDGMVVGWNEHAAELLGWARADVLGRDLIDLMIPEAHRDGARTWLARLGSGNGIINLRDPAEFAVCHADGSTVPVEINLWRVDSGSSSRLCILVRDISARKAAEERLTRKATHDSLTELPNRELLLDLLATEVAASESRSGYIGVIFVDLDRFKAVNDTLGHRFGDLLLASVANRLRRGVRPDDVVGRLSGDEFLVVCRHIAAPEEIASVATRLRSVLAEPIDVEGTSVIVSASMGTAVAEPGASSATELVRQADQAMYRDKHSQRPVRRSSPPARPPAPARLMVG